jgi:hypothetical protein
MKRIVKIAGVGNVAFPDSMSDVEVSQAAGRLYDEANPSGTSQDTSDWRKIQTSDGAQYLIHPEDLEEAKKRDPELKILDEPDQP